MAWSLLRHDKNRIKFFITFQKMIDGPKRATGGKTGSNKEK